MKDTGTIIYENAELLSFRNYSVEIEKRYIRNKDNKGELVIQLRNIGLKIIRSCTINVYIVDEKGEALASITLSNDSLCANPEEVFHLGCPMNISPDFFKDINAVVVDIKCEDIPAPAMEASIDEPNDDPLTTVLNPTMYENHAQQTTAAQESSKSVTSSTVQPTPPVPPVQPSQPTVSPIPVTPTKPAKKTNVLVIIIPIVLAVVALVIVISLIIKPYREKARLYDTGMSYYNSGQYTEAINVFEELGDYSDSSDLIKECRFLYAESLCDEGKYEEALKAAKALSNGDRTRKLKEKCQEGLKKEALNEALKEADAGNYETAISMVKEIKSYKPAREKEKELNYTYACKLLDENDYVNAIKYLSNVSDSKKDDAEEKILEAKFNYVTEHKDETDDNTVKYLRSLLEIEYDGALDLYTDIYKWKISIIAVNNIPKSEKQMDEIYSGDKICYMYNVKGPSGAKLKINTYASLEGTKLMDEPFEVNNGKYYLYYEEPVEFFGTVTIEFYDVEHNMKIASRTIPMLPRVSEDNQV